jgi:hypothetical protein
MVNQNGRCQGIYGTGCVMPCSTREKKSASREPFVPDFWPGEEPHPNLPWNPADLDRQPVS